MQDCPEIKGNTRFLKCHSHVLLLRKYSFFNKIELSFLLESLLFYPVHHPPQFEVWSCFVLLLICVSLWVADAIQMLMKHFLLPGLIARWHFPVSPAVKCSYVIDV